MIKTVIIILLGLIGLDALWLGVLNDKLYLDTVEAIQNKPLSFRLWPAVFVYPLMAIGLAVFVMENKGIPDKYKWLGGALLGLLIYGVYNGTNMAIFDEWSVRTAVSDTVWGTFLFGFSAWVAQQVTPLL